MKNEERHVLDELSAYIDGEAKDPARIARHLQGCAACARHHMQLLKVSAHVRAIPMPEARPEFAARVLARIAEQEDTPAPFWRRPAWMTAFAAAAALAIGLAGFFAMNAPPQPDNGPAQLVAKSIQLRDTGAVVGAFVGLFDDGVDAEALEAALQEPGWQPESYALDPILDLVAETRPEDFALGFNDPENDLFAMIDTLDTEESFALRELLRQRLMDATAKNTKG